MAYNKYKNQKVQVCGIKFDSKAEARRYLELKAREQSGEISNLRLQVPFELIPTQREPDTIGPRGGVKKGKVVHSAIKYVADFVYIENGEEIVEDCKGVRTQVYNMKKKLFYYRYKKNIVETSEKKKQEKERQKQRLEKLKADGLRRRIGRKK